MGTKLFDYLHESIFFDAAAVSTGFSSVSEDDLRTELTRYRDFALANLDDLLHEIYACQSTTKIFTGVRRHRDDIDLLKQGAFYIEQVVLDDPLFQLTKRSTEQGKVINEYLGMSGGRPLQEDVAAAAAKLRHMKPMIAADYVKLLPVSYLFEPPEQTPIYYSENFFEDVLPPEFMSFFKSNAEVRSMRRDDHSYVEESSLHRCRAISVRFKNDPFEHIRTYQLWEQEVVSFNETTREMKVGSTLPAEPPDQTQFEGWIRQSINRTAAQVHHEVALQMALANDLKAAYLTRSQFTFELLRLLAPDADPSKMRAATTLLNVELPFIDEVDVQVLMDLRRQEQQAFDRFRRSLDGKLRELASIKDAEEQRLKADDISAELIENAHEVGQVVSRAQKKLAANATLTVAGLSAAVATGGWSLPVAIGTAAAGYKAYQEYRGATDAPAFFLWKSLQKSKR